jgi:hypothetical protein
MLSGRVAVRIAVDQCKLVGPPPRGFFRVTDWHAPFDPPPPPAPLNIAGGEVSDPPSGRWDDPDGKFRTLYCATSDEGAVGEKLADFAPNPRAVVRVEAYLAEAPDEEFADEQLMRAVDAEDIASFKWTLAWAPADEGARYLDVNHWKTFIASRPGAAPVLRELGLRAFDRGTLLDERRSVTRRLAGFWHAATDGASIAGLQYTSRLPPAWTCWALWEPPALDASQTTTERLTIDSPAVRAAARKLGIVLADS